MPSQALSSIYMPAVGGSSTESRQTLAGVLLAMHIEMWQRRPLCWVLIHLQQCSHFASMGSVALVRTHNLEHIMSRRENCQDNAVAETFSSSLERKHVNCSADKAGDEALQTCSTA